eukprot:TRINITY_DN20880_c0_g2_i1.p1 TRINITY_DN20880_c0_g2~~TRINITY_DN20880_c0_g2_i1.p1  ORF type:complete len:202 (-),score=29.67 TRINITY_DN20880_c0_g2_i1:76-681(-)
MIRRPPRSTQSRSSAASDVYKRQITQSSTGIFVSLLLIYALIANSQMALLAYTILTPLFVGGSGAMILLVELSKSLQWFDDQEEIQPAHPRIWWRNYRYLNYTSGGLLVLSLICSFAVYYLRNLIIQFSESVANLEEGYYNSADKSIVSRYSSQQINPDRDMRHSTSDIVNSHNLIARIEECSAREEQSIPTSQTLSLIHI